MAAANLHAFNYGLKGDRDPTVSERVLDSMKIPEFQPRVAKIQVRDDKPVNDEPAKGEAAEEEVNGILSSLPQPSDLAGFRLNPVEFEKDNACRYQTFLRFSDIILVSYCWAAGTLREIKLA